MAVPTGTVTLADIQQEFGGTEPISLNEYYRGGTYVPDGAGTALIPTSGPISMNNFRGASKTVTITYAIIGGGGAGGFGDNNAGEDARGTFGAAGGASSISGTNFQTITAAGGAGGENCGGNRGTVGTAGASTIYGSGGAGGPLNTAGGAASGLGAGGGGGGGDRGSTFDEGGCSGFGGGAGTLLTGTVEVDYGTELTVVIGGGGATNTGRSYYGGAGASGRCQISWGANSSTFTSNGSVTIT